MATVPVAAVTVLSAVLVTAPVTPVTVPAAAVVTRVAVEATAPVTPVTVPVAAVAAALTVLAAPESRPLGELWVVAACAGAASSRPMPKATARPPVTAPTAYKHTLRAGIHQPFMSGTLIHT